MCLPDTSTTPVARSMAMARSPTMVSDSAVMGRAAAAAGSANPVPTGRNSTCLPDGERACTSPEPEMVSAAASRAVPTEASGFASLLSAASEVTGRSLP